MGPIVDRRMQVIRLRPFQTSTTFRNLAREKVGVFHVTDDVELLAAAAIGQPVIPPMHAVAGIKGKIITDACRWYAFEVTSLDDSQPRAEIECRVVQHGQLRPFFGWNRAMHAVLEAAILATRIGLISAEEIQTQLKPLSVIVEKTASENERRAFAMIAQFVEDQS